VAKALGIAWSLAGLLGNRKVFIKLAKGGKE